MNNLVLTLAQAQFFGQESLDDDIFDQSEYTAENDPSGDVPTDQRSSTKLNDLLPQPSSPHNTHKHNAHHHRRLSVLQMGRGSGELQRITDSSSPSTNIPIVTSTTSNHDSTNENESPSESSDEETATTVRDEESIARIIDFFELPSMHTHQPNEAMAPTAVLSHHSCALLRSVLLNGHLYITSYGICFASSLKRRGPILEGYLGKRGKLHHENRCWFVLYKEQLTIFKHSKNSYMPLKTIPTADIDAVEREPKPAGLNPESSATPLSPSFVHSPSNPTSPPQPSVHSPITPFSPSRMYSSAPLFESTSASSLKPSSSSTSLTSTAPSSPTPAACFPGHPNMFSHPPPPTLRIIRAGKKPLVLVADSRQQQEEWGAALEYASYSSRTHAKDQQYEKVVVPWTSISAISQNAAFVLPRSIAVTLSDEAPGRRNSVESLGAGPGEQLLFGLVANHDRAVHNMMEAWRGAVSAYAPRAHTRSPRASGLFDGLPHPRDPDSSDEDENVPLRRVPSNMMSNVSDEENEYSASTRTDFLAREYTESASDTASTGSAATVIDPRGSLPVPPTHSFGGHDITSPDTTPTGTPLSSPRGSLKHAVPLDAASESSSRKAEFARLFQSGEQAGQGDETLLKSYRCGFQGLSTIVGRMYLTNKRIAYYHKGVLLGLGKPTLLSLYYNQISAIWEGNSALFLSHAFTVITISGQEYCFHSFRSSHKAYTYAHSLWFTAHPKNNRSWRKSKELYYVSKSESSQSAPATPSASLSPAGTLGTPSAPAVVPPAAPGEMGELPRYFNLKESLLEVRGCTLMRSSIPIRGRVFLSETHLCFRSSPISPTRRVIIPLASVETMDKERSTLVVFYAIRVTTKDGKSFLFTVFTPRDAFYFKLYAQWEAVNSRASSATTPTGSRPPPTEMLVDEGENEALAAPAGILGPSERHDDLDDEERSLGLSRSIQEQQTLASFAQPVRSLRIVILTIGSRGDVQPFIALGLGLQKAGHRVAIATHMQFKEFVSEYGLEFRALYGDPRDLMQLVVNNGLFTYKFIKAALASFRGFVENLLRTCWTACQDADAIIEAPSVIAGHHVAERLNVPLFGAFTMPWTRTSWFPNPFAVPDHPLGKKYNYFTYLMIEQMFWQPIRDLVNKWRVEDLGLPAIMLGGGGHQGIARVNTPFLYCFSKHLVPKPPDWPDWIVPCGYWFVDNPASSNWTPPEALVQFLDQPGPPPIYIGFGSIIVEDPDALTKTILEAVAKSGQRAILGTGWADLKVEELPPTVFTLAACPHEWLFPRVSMVCHHGGAGTTAAGLRFGKPTIIIGFFGDQFFWGQRVKERGVGTAFAYKSLEAGKLAKAITKCLTNAQIQTRVQEIAERIGAEDGVQTAVDTFHKYLDLSTTTG